MKRSIWVALFSFVLIFCSACSVKPQDPAEKMKHWFLKGTGLALPAEVRFIAGKNTSAWLSDIYLKLQVPPSYQEVLNSNLKQVAQAPSFALPSNMEAWPAWGMDGKDFVYYSKTTGDVDRGGFISHLAFDQATGTLFCHFVEYTP